MTDDEEKLRKFLESDDPALVMMGLSIAKGAGVEVTLKDLERFLKNEDVETIKMGFTFAEEAGVGDEAMEMLCEELGDQKWFRVQNPIAKALEEIGDTRAIEPLIGLLSKPPRHDPSAVRYYTARIIGKIGKPAVEPLIEVLLLPVRGAADPLYGAREYATKALEKIGKPAVEPLIEVLSDRRRVGPKTRSGARMSAAKALGEIGDERAIELLIEVLSDVDWWVRTYASRALGKFGDTRAVEPLIGLLSDETGSVREAAAEALGRIGDLRAVEPLIKALVGDDSLNWTYAIRRNAAEALGKIGDEQAVEPLIQVLEDVDDDDEVRGAAAEALEYIGDRSERGNAWQQPPGHPGLESGAVGRGEASEAARTV